MASVGAHPLSEAGSSPPGPAGCCLSAGRSWAQTGCGASAWRRGACSIVLLLPPLSPRTSPTYRKDRKTQLALESGDLSVVITWKSAPEKSDDVCAYLADSFHSNSPPSCWSVSISVKIVGVGMLSSSPNMLRSRSAAGDTATQQSHIRLLTFGSVIYLWTSLRG